MIYPLVVLQRLRSSDEGTFGSLRFDGLSLGTCELPWRDNQPQKSCIPPSTYHCKRRVSPKFGYVYHVEAVPNRSNILLHPANFGGNVDAGWQSDLLGCIAIGMHVGYLSNKFGKAQEAVVDSRVAFQKFYAAMKDVEFILRISAPNP